jgi:DNA-binding beta-propeller fold protein YncE
VVTAVDSKARRVWLANQCGAGSDPIYAFDADNFAPIAGPIRTGGVLGGATVNPATGRLYVNPSEVSKRVDPKTFEVTDNAFGVVLAADPFTGRLFAMADKTLQIIDGIPDPEVIVSSVPLDYSPSGMAINHSLHHLYLSNSAKSCIEVRDLATGALVTTFPIVAGATPGGIGVDSVRGRLYVLASSGEKNRLYVIHDDSTHPKIMRK